MPPEATAPESPLKFLSPEDLADTSRFARVATAPLLDEHKHEKKGDISPDLLRVIAENTNVRCARGDFPTILLGHTFDEEGREKDQPRPVGVGANFRVGDYRGRACLFADLFIRVEDLKEAGTYPHRSVERVRSDKDAAWNYIEAISLLRRAPERHLGLLTYASTLPEGASREQYASDRKLERYFIGMIKKAASNVAKSAPPSMVGGAAMAGGKAANAMGSVGSSAMGAARSFAGMKSAPSAPASSLASAGGASRDRFMSGIRAIRERNAKSPAWQRKEGQNPEGGLNEKGRASLRSQGKDIKEPVTEDNPKGKRASRRKSFCARMSGMKKRLTSKETANDPDSRINKSLRKWRCSSDVPEGVTRERFMSGLVALRERYAMGKAPSPMGDYSVDDDGDSHVLSHRGSPVGGIDVGGPGMMEGRTARISFPGVVGDDDPVHRIHGIHVEDEHQGKRLGQALYLHAGARRPGAWFYNSQAEDPAVRAYDALERKGLAEVHWRKRQDGTPVRGGAHLYRLTPEGHATYSDPEKLRAFLGHDTEKYASFRRPSKLKGRHRRPISTARAKAKIGRYAVGIDDAKKMASDGEGPIGRMNRITKTTPAKFGISDVPDAHNKLNRHFLYPQKHGPDHDGMYAAYVPEEPKLASWGGKVSDGSPAEVWPNLNYDAWGSDEEMDRLLGHMASPRAGKAIPPTIGKHRDYISVHEAGHALHYPRVDEIDYSDPMYRTENVWSRVKPFDLNQIGMNLGSYAMTDPEEFVAEAFSRQVLGKPLPKGLQSLYRDLRGPDLDDLPPEFWDIIQRKRYASDAEIERYKSYRRPARTKGRRRRPISNARARLRQGLGKAVRRYKLQRNMDRYGMEALGRHAAQGKDFVMERSPSRPINIGRTGRMHHGASAADDRYEKGQWVSNPGQAIADFKRGNVEPSKSQSRERMSSRILDGVTRDRFMSGLVALRERYASPGILDRPPTVVPRRPPSRQTSRLTPQQQYSDQHARRLLGATKPEGPPPGGFGPEILPPMTPDEASSIPQRPWIDSAPDPQPIRPSLGRRAAGAAASVLGGARSAVGGAARRFQETAERHDRDQFERWRLAEEREAENPTPDQRFLAEMPYGAGTGAVLGGIAGGPLGALAGGFAGAGLGAAVGIARGRKARTPSGNPRTNLDNTPSGPADTPSTAPSAKKTKLPRRMPLGPRRDDDFTPASDLGNASRGRPAGQEPPKPRQNPLTPWESLQAPIEDREARDARARQYASRLADPRVSVGTLFSMAAQHLPEGEYKPLSKKRFVPGVEKDPKVKDALIHALASHFEKVASPEGFAEFKASRPQPEPQPQAQPQAQSTPQAQAPAQPRPQPQATPRPGSRTPAPQASPTPASPSVAPSRTKTKGFIQRGGHEYRVNFGDEKHHALYAIASAANKARKGGLSPEARKQFVRDLDFARRAFGFGSGEEIRRAASRYRDQVHAQLAREHDDAVSKGFARPVSPPSPTSTTVEDVGAPAVPGNRSAQAVGAPPPGPTTQAIASPNRVPAGPSSPSPGPADRPRSGARLPRPEDFAGEATRAAMSPERARAQEKSRAANGGVLPREAPPTEPAPQPNPSRILDAPPAKSPAAAPSGKTPEQAEAQKTLAAIAAERGLTDKIVSLYKGKRYAKDIAADLGISKDMVYAVVDEAKVPRNKSWVTEKNARQAEWRKSYADADAAVASVPGFKRVEFEQAMESAKRDISADKDRIVAMGVKGEAASPHWAEHSKLIAEKLGGVRRRIDEYLASDEANADQPAPSEPEPEPQPEPEADDGSIEARDAAFARLSPGQRIHMTKAANASDPSRAYAILRDQAKLDDETIRALGFEVAPQPAAPAARPTPAPPTSPRPSPTPKATKPKAAGKKASAPQAPAFTADELEALADLMDGEIPYHLTPDRIEALTDEAEARLGRGVDSQSVRSEAKALRGKKR